MLVFQYGPSLLGIINLMAHNWLNINYLGSLKAAIQKYCNVYGLRRSFSSFSFLMPQDTMKLLVHATTVGGKQSETFIYSTRYSIGVRQRLLQTVARKVA